MIDQYELYHGAVLRSLIANSSVPLTLEVSDFGGRINSFMVNRRVGIFLKHSAKRVSPWQFTFNSEHIQEFSQLSSVCAKAFSVLVCGHDGLVAIPYEQFCQLVSTTENNQGWIRISRSRNYMYSVSGSSKNVSCKVAAGLEAVNSSLMNSNE